MANNTAGNPWILDTAGEVWAAGQKVTIIKMIFYAAVANDDLAVSDGNSHSFWKVRAVSAGTNYEDYAGVPFDLVRPIQLDGFVIDTIDGGELWVWVG